MRGYVLVQRWLRRSLRVDAWSSRCLYARLMQQAADSSHRQDI